MRRRGMLIRRLAIALWCLLFCDLAFSQIAPQTRGNTPGGAYRIGGVLINASTGEPIGRAVVEALNEEDGRAVASGVTDSEGRFALDRLAAAKYELTASKRGYITGAYDQHDGFSSAIVTGPDQDTTHLEFRLTPDAVLRGAVMDEAGEPVSGAKVMLFKRPKFAGTGERMLPANTTMTDDVGAYEFGNLAAGEYLLAVVGRPWYAVNEGAAERRNPALDVAYPVTYFDSTTEEQAAKPIVMSAGRREEADISLHAVPALHLSVPFTREAVEASQPPQLQQTIFGSAVSSDSSINIRDPHSNTLEMSGIAPGSYVLTQGDPPRVANLELTSNIQVDPNSGSPANPVEGTIRMLSGAPVPDDVTVSLTRLDNSSGQPMYATQARQNSFRFESVPQGEWTFAATSGGRALSVMAVSTGSAQREGNRVTLRDRTPAFAITLSDASTKMEGFARKNDKGFAGAMIVLLPNNPAQWKSLTRRDQSDSDGSFALPDVAPAQYTLIAIEDGWDLDWSSPAAMARYLPSGISIRVTEQSGASMRLTTPVTVQPR